ncbi:hypothetical protein G9A89_021202 [Geosiphon pyriformis]|nr:hypothetical protein G9A89_021202 [Geosiphon pyriformis]
MAFNPIDDSGLVNHLASLKHFLELLSDQSCKFDADVITTLCSPLLVASLLNSALDSDIVVDSVVVPFSSSLPLVNKAISELSLNSSKVFITKIDGLKSKMMALEVLVNSIADRFDGVWVFTSGVNSGNLGSGITIIMDISLAHHVCKIFKVFDQLLSFFQAGEINSIIAKAVNESFFVVLGGNFNKNGSHKCASFKKCFDFGLVNSFGGSFFVKTPTWANSHSVTKTINFLFVFSNLVNAVVDCNMCGVRKFFNTDNWAVSVSVGLGGLLDVQLNSLHKQTNRDWWKFDFKGADVNK